MVKLTDRQTIGTQTIGFVARGLGIMAAILLAVGSLLSIRDAGGPPSPISVASADLQRSAPTQTRYSSKAIRDIQPIADRVLAENPETPGQAPSDFGDFDRESWRIVRLEVPKPDGEWMRVTLARPPTWLETAEDFFERLPVNFILTTSRSFAQLARQNATAYFHPDFHVGEHPRHLSPPDFSPGNPP